MARGVAMDDDKLMKFVYNAFEPSTPATVENYFDCMSARGSSGFTKYVLDHITQSKSPRTFLFSGHLGCGKSSELEALRRALQQPDETGKAYVPVFVQADEYLDDYDVSSIDILLAILTELAATLRESFKIEVEDNYFQKRKDQFGSLLFTDVQLESGDLTLGPAKVKIQGLKRDRDARHKVREALQPEMSSFLEEINIVIEEARGKLRNLKGSAFCDLVLIVDNLEKINRVDGKAEGLESHRELFLERYTQLTGMTAHVIYTIPLDLIRSTASPQLLHRYREPFVLPMVKIAHRDETPYEDGIQCLRGLLQKRLKGEYSLALDTVFVPEALDFLLRYSGGNTRSLMNFVQNASTYRSALPIGLEAAHRAIQQTVRTFATSIPEAHWKKLADLQLSPDQSIPNGDNDCLEMLSNLSILEYLNGESDENPFTNPVPWYAVHPIVRELRRFNEAVSAVSLERQTAGEQS